MHNNSNRCLYNINLLILFIQSHVPVLVFFQNHKQFTIYTIMSASIKVYSGSVIDFFLSFHALTWCLYHLIFKLCKASNTNTYKQRVVNTKPFLCVHFPCTGEGKYLNTAEHRTYFTKSQQQTVGGDSNHCVHTQRDSFTLLRAPADLEPP